ncbi:MAG: DUF748 domain-containing protein [Xanthomonadales bacterium]
MKFNRAQWLNPRRKRFWAVVAVLLYTLLGFFVVPLVVKNSILNLIQDDFARSAKIKKVEFNPYVLSLRMQGFELDDSDGVSLAAFDEFYVNFQLSSLFRWAWTFREIRLVNPYFFFERFAPGDSRLSRLLADAAGKQPDQAGGEDEGGLPRLLIHDLILSEGRIDARDNVPATPVDLQLGPINIAIQELNTLPGRHGRQSVTIRLPNDSSLHWEGSLTLAPLDSEGELVLKNSHLDQTIAYLEAVLPLESISARLSSRFHYRIHMESDGGLDLEIDDLEIELSDLLVSGLTPVTDFLAIPKITIQGGTLRYPEQSLHFGSLRIADPRLTAWLNENGGFSLEDLGPASTDRANPDDPDEDRSQWRIGLDQLILEGGSLDLADQSVKPTATVGVRELQVKLTNISNQDDVQFPLSLSGRLEEGGSFSLDARLGLFPEFSLTGKSQTRGVPLSLGQPYVQQFAHVLIEAGALDSEIELSIQPGQAMTISGAIRVPGLEIKDSIENQRLLGWDQLAIDHFDLDLDVNKAILHFSSLIFTQPFGRMVIRDNQTTNLTGLMIEQEAQSTQSATGNATSTDTNDMAIIVGGIRIEDGSMDFTDLSLPLPFATHIAKMDGTISTIATNSAEPANIKLEGQVDEYGLARIDGSINMLDPIRHTDITLEFRNLLMSNLSPYSAQFAGREIDDGKLDLDLRYAIDKGQLKGQNKVVLSDLLLGAKVDHPDAASLPLGLAVALLTDANGVISIDLPVAGDINDPKFSIGGVVWQAIAGLVTKIVTAPFRFLGKLIGIDSEDLGQFEFLAGRADLTPPEREKVVQLEEALRQRPELVVEISGVSDPAIDVPALKYIRLRDVVRERLGEEVDGDADETMMLDVEIRQVLESLFAERYPDIPLEARKAEHTAPPADSPQGKPVLDDLAYATDLKDRLLVSESISEQDLALLAQARAEAIRAAFLASGQFDEGRVVIAESKEVESKDGEWVTLELAVAPEG